MVLLMKRTVTFALVLGVVLVTVITQRTSLAEANFYPFKQNYCDISIHSPQSLSFENGNILLNFTVKSIVNIPPLYSYFYILDGEDLQSSVKIEDVQIVSEEEITNETLVPYTETTVRGQAQLPLLTIGSHSIKVFYGYFVNGKINYVTADPYSATADFIVISGTASPFPEPTDYTGVRLSETEVIIGGAFIVAIVIIGLGLLLYLIKRNR